jgi:hypothetical protein
MEEPVMVLVSLVFQVRLPQVCDVPLVSVFGRAPPKPAWVNIAWSEVVGRLFG